jgi:SAM-dependent methyltransferase
VQKDFYSEYYEVEDKHWWFIGRRRVILRLLDLYFAERDSEPREILDVGCGTGMMLGYLAGYGTVRGVDADERAVSFCKKRGLDNVSLFDGLTLPFADNTFDLVTMFDVLEHIEDDRSAIGEVFRVLKAGGTFMITVPAYRFLWGPQDEINLHKRRYNAPQLAARINEQGFKIAKLSYFNTLLFPGIAGIRLLRRLAPSHVSGVTELKSDFTLTKRGALNTFLATLFGLERLVVGRINVPFGVSIVCMAHRST